MRRKNNKLILVKINFSMKNYNALLKKNIRKSSAPVRDLFYFIEFFGRLHNINDTVSAWTFNSKNEHLYGWTILTIFP